MPRALDRVVDSLDIETFILCKDEAEARALAEELAREMNLSRPDIVFLEHRGPGARIRLRTYIHRPGDHYHWLEQEASDD